MTSATTPLPERGDGNFARDFVPPTHRGLRLVRIFLPLLDSARRPVRWSQFVDLENASASLSWWELVDEVADDFPEVRDLVSCGGELDEATAEALQDAVGDSLLQSLRWDGYWENPASSNPVYVYEHEYSLADLLRSDLRAGTRIPEFVWDEAGTFAWGARLYPDSLIVACRPGNFTKLRADPRLDTVTIRLERDILPPSFGD